MESVDRIIRRASTFTRAGPRRTYKKSGEQLCCLTALRDSRVRPQRRKKVLARRVERPLEY